MDTPHPATAEEGKPCAACGAPLRESFTVFSPKTHTYEDLCASCLDARPLPSMKPRQEVR